VGDIGAPELLIIGVVIVLLFGATRLPATAKGLGQALRLFKKEIRADDEPATVAQLAPAEVAPVELSGAAVTQADATRTLPQPVGQVTTPTPVESDQRVAGGR
jgi:sec-independent protein translocase protein TatA